MFSLDDIVDVPMNIVVLICHCEFVTDPFFLSNSNLCHVALKSCGAVNQPKKCKNLKYYVVVSWHCISTLLKPLTKTFQPQ